ncbi:hypothetical protein [Streptomyces sp. NBC_01304]|uniref:hypothetical protein n=1 Tax=Streptomyces sp. NBC_01304 TaxID=2903818 RepID=UPI002E11175C|nr:hypothetical protein OG430_01025 [Streptomyces sp. NBC_01304]
MKITRYVTAAALGIALAAAGTTTAVAKPDPKEQELQRRTEATLKYFCNTPHHDDTYYKEHLDAWRLDVWAWKNGTVPVDEALARIADRAESSSEDMLGTGPAGLSDAMRTRICTDSRAAFLDELDKLTDNDNKLHLKPEYRNEEALSKFPFDKLAAFEKAMKGEQGRLK